MSKAIFITVILSLVFSVNVYSQDYSFNKKIELENKIISPESNKDINTGFNKNINLTSEKKSPGVALLLSLVIPGAGHFYADRMDVGKYFVTTEVMSWLGIVGLNLYGNYLRNDARSYSSLHSGLNKENKDDNYFTNVANYNNIYEYNDEKLRRGEYDKMYDVGSYFWNWDNYDNRIIYDLQRKKSERVYNSRTIFATVLIVNRIVSGISSAILVKNQNSNSASFLFNPEIISTPGNIIGGFKLNLTKSF
jgi:hypothetical protein